MAHFIVRIFIGGKLASIGRFKVRDDQIETLVKSALIFVEQEGGIADHMIEVEDLDEPDPQKRFLRVGSNPRGMVKPLAVDLGKKRAD